MNSANDSPTSSDAGLGPHLAAELARLDLLLHRQVERWRRAGQDASDAFRGLYVSDEEVAGLLQRPLGGSWADLDSRGLPDDEDMLSRVAAHIHGLSQSARAQGRPAPLDRLVELFRLRPFEKDALLLTLAPALDLRYQRIYGYLQDDVTKKNPTVNLALDLFADQETRLAHLAFFDPNAPLFRNLLLRALDPAEPLLQQALVIDPAVPAWLLGQFQPANLLIPGPEAARDTDNPELPPYDSRLVLAFTGPDELAQRQAAAALSARSEKPRLVLDFIAQGDPTNLLPAVRRSLRDALLIGAIPELRGWEMILKDDSPPDVLFEELLSYPDLVLIESRNPWRSRAVDRTRRIRELAFPVPTFRERLALWERLLEDHPERGSLELPHLAGQFALTSGQIRDAYAEACDTAAQAARKAVSAGDLLAAARGHSNPRLGSLARKIEPRFDWDDIVLPRDQVAILCEITTTVRQRPRVLDDWGVGLKLASSRGVTVLFAGPPGTGKTMAAEIMAGDLGLDLYKIDLSGVVSKYIGETEKNLEKVFEEAASSNAILFFDEADALFGKRSEVRDAHDRYANLEISYLLQRMEAYDGVTILATNLRANLDEAFTRRLQFAVDFPIPEEEDRLRIWKALLPPRLPVDKGVDFTFLARRFRISGGNIRNVIVNAAYLAAADGGVVKMEHLLHGTRRELQKMGRLLNEEDLITP